MSLPVMLDLRGRRVVAVGGGSVTARRVATFVAEGAVVEVIAPTLDPVLAALVADGSITWTGRRYVGAVDLAGAWLVHVATADDGVDALVADDADRARIWCVRAGSAALTPAALPARATLTTPDGPVQVAAYAAGDPRRAVAVRNSIIRESAEGRLDLRGHRPRQLGWVALVGGGPGADGLLTTRGAQLLASADVVVVDRLAPMGVLKHLPDAVRVIDVGKSPTRHPVPQHEINAILVDEARRGHAVVRLKGGDPYVLGRGGEERLHCEAHGIPVEVVPGVSSAVAVPAAAGIPVTHRGVARGFTVMTGHEDLPSLPGGSDHTLVVLMGVAQLAETSRHLLEHGRPASTPVAVIERGFAPDQRTTFGTLATIADIARSREVSNPAVVVVGDVVRLAPDYPDA